MRSKTNLIAGLLLLVALMAPASAGLFGPPTQTFQGRVNYIQPTNITLLTNDSKMVRIMTRDRKVPAEVQIGVVVKVRAVLGEDQLWYLDKFERIQLQPNQ